MHLSQPIAAVEGDKLVGKRRSNIDRRALITLTSQVKENETVSVPVRVSCQDNRAMG